MKKAIRILSIIAAAIMVLTAVLFLAAVLLQGVLGPMLYHYPETIREFFEFPAGQAVYILGVTAVTILLATTGGMEKIGIWVELLCAALIGVVLPLIQSVLSVAQHVMLGMQGNLAMVANSMVNSLCSYATFLMPVATTLALLAAGMSICYKRMIRKLN